MIWVPAADLDGDGEAADGRPAAGGLRFLRRIKPATAQDVGPEAARYDVLVHNEMSPRRRRAAAAAGAVATVIGVAALAAGMPWGVMALLGGVALIATGIVGGDESLTLCPCATGGWVEVDAELPPAEPTPLFARWERLMYGILAAAFTAMALTGRIEGNLLLVGVVSAGFAAAAVWDSLPIRRRDPHNAMLAELCFRELADPARPLSDADFALKPDSAERRVVP